MSAQRTLTESQSLTRALSSPPTYWIGLLTLGSSGSSRANSDSTPAHDTCLPGLRLPTRSGRDFGTDRDHSGWEGGTAREAAEWCRQGLRGLLGGGRGVDGDPSFRAPRRPAQCAPAAG